MTTEQLTHLLMWCTIVNIGLMTVSVIMVLIFRSFITKLHGKLFKLPEESISLAIYYFFGFWKILTFIFFVIPWVCLRFII